MFDGFDFTVLTFILIDIQKTFAVDAVLAGALGTVTLVMRLVGGVVSGTMADRWGRKRPLMLSILWLSIFAFLSGFSTSYPMLFALRALFGIGIGGVWGAGVPLTRGPGRCGGRGDAADARALAGASACNCIGLAPGRLRVGIHPRGVRVPVPV